MLEQAFAVDLGQRLGQLRAVPITLASGRQAIAILYSADFDIDPAPGMFFFPTDSLKLAVVGLSGELIWRRDLGNSAVPGVWFCPFYAMDLDGDDELYLVTQSPTDHPLDARNYHITCVDSTTGQNLHTTPWPDALPHAPMYQIYRYFLFGGQVRGEPVLVAAQGTYGTMCLRAFNRGMKIRWEHTIPSPRVGAAGSHMCPVLDIDGDGSDELLWGERLIRLDDGSQTWCADQEVYRGHSDIVQPILDRETDEWLIFTCRESDPEASPRVVCFDAQGQQRWGDLEAGHIDMGWAAHVPGDGNSLRTIAMAIRIDGKTCGADGRHHTGIESFAYNAKTGERIELPFDPYRTVPVDLDGDGLHEFVRGIPGGDGELLAADGRSLGHVGGTLAAASKLIDHPGEQLLTFTPDGQLVLWRNPDARDTDVARARYAHPFYTANQHLTGVGYNLINLGGI